MLNKYDRAIGRMKISSADCEIFIKNQTGVVATAGLLTIYSCVFVFVFVFGSVFVSIFVSLVESYFPPLIVKSLSENQSGVAATAGLLNIYGCVFVFVSVFVSIFVSLEE